MADIKSTSKYLVKRKYKTINGTTYPMDEYQVILYEENSDDCGYVPTLYQWSATTGHICDYETYTKYVREVKMVSYDEGETWSAVVPTEERRGEVIEYDSYDCGKEMTRCVETDDTFCRYNLPSGYTEVEYIRQNSSYNAYIDTGVIPYGSSGNTFEVSAKMKAYYKNTSCDTFLSCEDVNSPYFGFGYRFVCAGGSNYQIFGGDSNTATTVTNNSDGTFTYVCSRSNVTTTYNMPISLFCSFSDSSYTTPQRFSDIEVYSMTITLNNEVVRNFVPAKRDSDNKYGLYDLITDTFYVSPNGNNFVGGAIVQ